MNNYFPGFTVTPTRIKTFLECPRKYWYYYVNSETKGKFPEKSYFTLGHHVHDALRDFFAIPPADRSPEKLLTLFEEAWSTKTGPEGGFKTVAEEVEAKERAIAMLNKFLGTEDWRIEPVPLPPTTGKIPGYRQAVVARNIAFGGVIDRMDRDPDGVLHIIDYKTGKHDDPDEWQLPMYAVFMGRFMNEPVGRTSYLFLDHARRHTEEISISKNVEIITRVLEIVDRIPKSKNKEDFVCVQKDRCRHCDYLFELGFDPITGKKIE